MERPYVYIGHELELFAGAKNWKVYFASVIEPLLGDLVLEAGAGIGTTTTVLNKGRAKAWHLLEPDEAFCQTLQQKIEEKQLPSNCRVILGNTSSLQPGGQYDSILYIDVLEHIEADAEEVRRAAALLKPGGRLIILSPAHQGLFSPFDKAIGHYRRYSKKSLAATVGLDWKPERLIYMDSIGYFASLVNNLLLRQSYPTRKQIGFWDKWMVPVSRVVDKWLGFGKTVVGVWKMEQGD